MRVALVLGSGGARGYAHLGALQELRARGHELAAVSGTSMGALVGALAAAGKDEEFADWARTLTQRRVLQLLDPVMVGPGAIRGTKVVTMLGGMLGDTTIEQLPVPFTAVATDLTSQREIWFQSGVATVAIRASIAIPGALTPVVLGGRVLVDGGLLNPVPMEPVLASDADFTLAINLNGPDSPSAGRGAATEEAGLPEGQDHKTWLARMGLSGLDLDRLLHRAPREVDQEVAEAVGVGAHSTTDVLLSSWETVQAVTTRFRMASNPPDIQVNVPMRICGTLDFHRAAELIDHGRRITAEALDQAGH